MTSGGTGPDQVQLLLNGKALTTMTSSPFVYDWDTSVLTAGAYTLQAKATDSTGNVATSPSVSFTVASNVPSASVGLSGG